MAIFQMNLTADYIGAKDDDGGGRKKNWERWDAQSLDRGMSVLPRKHD